MFNRCIANSIWETTNARLFAFKVTWFRAWSTTSNPIITTAYKVLMSVIWTGILNEPNTAFIYTTTVTYIHTQIVYLLYIANFPINIIKQSHLKCIRIFMNNISTICIWVKVYRTFAIKFIANFKLNIC